MVQPSSEIGKHAIETAAVLGADVVRLPEVALPLGRFLGEDVAAVGVACLVLAGSGLPEALGRAPMRLDLGHCDGPWGRCCHWRGRRQRTVVLSVLPMPVCKSLILCGIKTGPIGVA